LQHGLWQWWFIRDHGVATVVGRRSFGGNSAGFIRDQQRWRQPLSGRSVAWSLNANTNRSYFVNYRSQHAVFDNRFIHAFNRLLSGTPCEKQSSLQLSE
jgi:hypothetical protein